MGYLDVVIANADKVIDWYKNGKSTIFISKELKVNHYFVWKFLDSKNLVRKCENYGILEKNESKILELYNQGLSCYKISKIIGTEGQSVSMFLKKRGLISNAKSKVNKNNLLKDKKELVIQMFKDCINLTQIANKVGHGESSIWRMINAEGLETGANNKPYDVDLHFFDKIDTWEKGYCLGMWYSDGNVMKDLIRIQLVKDDEQILHDIKRIMKYEGPIHYIKRKNSNSRDMVSLCIGRKDLSIALIKLGCVTNKSLILKFPTPNIVPDELMSAFLLGVMDGDGSVSLRSNGKTVNVGFSGIKGFLDEVNNYLNKKLGVNGVFYFRKVESNTGSLWFNKVAESLKILNYLYNGATMFLKRKHDNYLIGKSFYGESRVCGNCAKWRKPTRRSVFGECMNELSEHNGKFLDKFDKSCINMSPT